MICFVKTFKRSINLKFGSCCDNFKGIIHMFIDHFHENIPTITNTLALSINYTEAMDSKSINTLTTNVLRHVKTSQLICIANQLTGFYMMGNIDR